MLLGRLKSWRGPFPGEQLSRLARGEQRCSERAATSRVLGGPGAPLTTGLQEGRSRRAAAAGIASDGRESACSAALPPRRGAVAPARRGSSLLRVAWVKTREQPSRAWIRSLRDLGAEKGRAVAQLASAIPGYAGPGASGLGTLAQPERIGCGLGAWGRWQPSVRRASSFSSLKSFWSLNRKISPGRACLFTYSFIDLPRKTPVGVTWVICCHSAQRKL